MVQGLERRGGNGGGDRERRRWIDGWKCRQEGDRKEGLGGRERGVVGSRVEFAANERAFALVDLTRARGQMPSRVPQARGP